MVNLNKLGIDERTRIVACLVEGTSTRTTCQITAVAKNTVTKPLGDLGNACEAFQRKHLVGLRAQRVQCHEIWSSRGAKEKNVRADLRGKPGRGDIWTRVAIDSDSNLAISWLVGKRDAGYANDFMQDVAGRLTSRVQLTTNGLSTYLAAVKGAYKNLGSRDASSRRGGSSDIPSCCELICGMPKGRSAPIRSLTRGPALCRRFDRPLWPGDQARSAARPISRIVIRFNVGCGRCDHLADGQCDVAAEPLFGPA